MKIDDKTPFGLMSQEVGQKIHCTEDSIWKAEEKSKISNCSTTANFKRDEFKKALLDNCNKKNNCTIDLGTDYPFSPTNADKNCKAQSFVFTQVSCVIDPLLQADRFIMGLGIGCMSVFVYLFSMVYFDYIKTVQSNLYVDWDVKTITAGDYTVEFDLAEDTYDFWKKNYYDETNPLPENGQFKLFI